MQAAIRFGIVGLGRLGMEHARNLRYHVPGAKLEAICSIDETQLKTLKAEWDIPETYTDFDSMIASDSLDAVLICSPSDLHTHHTKAALKAGLHVFCEKPIALNSYDAQVIVDRVAEYPNQKFMLGFMRRFDPAYRHAKKMIEDGVIGTPFFYRGYGLDPLAAMDGFLNFARNADSGGIFMDLSIHDFDLARWYLSAEAESVWAIGGTYRHHEIADLNDAEAAAALMKFDDNKMAMFLASRSSVHGYHVEAEIIGTHGTLQVGRDPIKNDVVLLNEHGIIHDVQEGFVERFKTAYCDELVAFVTAIQENLETPIGAIEGLYAVKMAEATRAAYKIGDIHKI